MPDPEMGKHWYFKKKSALECENDLFSHILTMCNSYSMLFVLIPAIFNIQ